MKGRLTLAVAAAVALAACSGPKPTMDQLLPPEVALRTVPDTCKVTVDGVDRGVTPLALKAEPGSERRKVVLSKEGYLPSELQLTNDDIRQHSSESIVHFMRPAMWDPARAPSIDPNDPVQLTRAGKDLAKAGRCPEAMPYLARALEIDARIAAAHKALGSCYAKQKDSAKALEHYKAYLLAAPDAPDADQVRAIVSRASGDIDMGSEKKR